MPEETPAPKPGEPFLCPACGESDWKAVYYEAVWQTIDLVVGDDGGPEFVDYTGVTGTYDDPSTEDEAWRCSACEHEITLAEILVGENMRAVAEELLAAEELARVFPEALAAAALGADLARLVLGRPPVG